MSRSRRHPLLLVLLTSVMVIDVLGVDAGTLARFAGGGGAADTADVDPPSPSADAKGRLELRLVPARPGAALASCSVLRPGPGNRSAVTLTPTPNKDGLSLLGDLAAGECGVRVQPVLLGDDGLWTLRADYKDSPVAVEGRAYVAVMRYSGTVAPDKPSVNEEDTLQLNLSLTLTAPAGHVTSLSDCLVTTPKAGRVQLQPGAPGRLAYAANQTQAQTLARGWCAVRISPVQPGDQGAWVLEATDAVTGVVYSGRADVTVYQRPLLVRPARPEVEAGETVVLRLVFPDNKPAAEVRGCQAVRPDGGVVQLTGTGPSAATTVVDGTVQPRGVDGLRGELCAVALAPLGPQHAGVWTLSAVGADGFERLNSARLVVKEKYKSGARPTVVAKMGTENLALSCGPDSAVACSLMDPAKQMVASFQGPCSHRLDRVRAAHAGNWTCSVLLKEYAAAVTDWFVLKLAAPVQIRTSARPQGQDVLLQCSLEGDGACATAPGYCRLDSPNGESHIVKDYVESAGPVSGRLWYAGRGMQACDCSVLLKGPLQPKDYGVWRCILGFNKVLGGLITLSADGAGGSGRQARGAAPRTPTAAEAFRVPMSGVVRTNQSMTVGCRAGRALSYCWLRTPRGHLLTVEEATRRYAGLGFGLGECAVAVTATANLSGTWRCGMGFRGNGEVTTDLEVAVHMIVSDSLVVPLQQNVTPSDGVATLGCRTLLSEGLQYCRFQRPDGVSIHVADALNAGPSGPTTPTSGRYKFDSDAGGLDRGFCAVTISPTEEVDLGVWTCTVGLSSDLPGKEQTASIELADDREFAEAALIGVGLGLVVLVTVVAAVIGYRRYRSAVPTQRSARYRRQGRGQEHEGIDMDSTPAAESPPSTGPTTRSRVRRLGTTPTSSGTSLSGAGGHGMSTTRLPSRTTAATRWGNMFGDTQPGELGAGAGAAPPNAAEDGDDDSSGGSEEWKIR